MQRPSNISLVLAAAAVVVGGALAVVWFSLPADGPVNDGQRSTPPRVAHPTPSAKQAPSAVIQRMLSGDYPRLTREQIAAYVDSQKHSALSLIAAWQLSGEPSWLGETAERFPEDPGVAAAMVTAHGANSETARWIEVLKSSDPSNALGPLYAAKAALTQNQPAEALPELAALESLSRLDLPTESWAREMTGAYHHAGYQGLEAEWAAMAQVRMPWAEIHGLNRLLTTAMTAAAESGDSRTAAQFGAGAMKAAALANHPGAGNSLQTQLVSLSMERQVLHQLDTFDLVPGGQRVVVERLSEMDRQMAGIKDLIAKSQALLPTLSESTARQYTRRVRTEGEVKALRWLIAR